MSNTDLRRSWLKLFIKTTRPHDYELEELKAVDALTVREVDTIVSALREDLKPMAELKFDEDFLEYLYEVGYEEGEEVDINEIAIEFAEWVKEVA